MCCNGRLPIFLMGGLLIVSAATLLLRIGNPAVASTEIQQTQSSEGKKVEEAKVLRHVVLFQFKETSSKDDVKKIVDAFRELPSKINAIADFEWGTNNSPEGLNDGLTHGFVISFKTEKDRDTYLNHPAHKAFVDVLLPLLQKPVVLDFWASK
ncbi:MAG: Dabb family protein [Pirellulales bacterium]